MNERRDVVSKSWITDIGKNLQTFNFAVTLSLLKQTRDTEND